MDAISSPLGTTILLLGGHVEVRIELCAGFKMAASTGDERAESELAKCEESFEMLRLERFLI